MSASGNDRVEPDTSLVGHGIRTGGIIQEAKGPAEVAASPSHGPNNPDEEKAMDVRSNTTAQAAPTSDVWFRRACEYESALRNVEVIASAAHTVMVEGGSARSSQPDMFDMPRRAFDEGTAFLRAIEDICARAREAE